jgi:hypothetical protein
MTKIFLLCTAFLVKTIVRKVFLILWLVEIQINRTRFHLKKNQAAWSSLLATLLATRSLY